MTNFQIPMHQSSKAFEECWLAAGRHLASQVDTGTLSFFRASLTPPILDHLSFRLGNQIFFVHVRDEAGKVRPPSDLRACKYAADMARGIPCIMDMRQQIDGQWLPAYGGWGLRHPFTRKEIDPVGLISDDLIEISDWELQDFCVQVVRNKISEDGGQILSWNSNPEVTPSIFFVDSSDQQHFVVVCSARSPDTPEPPANILEIRNRVAQHTASGYLALVEVAPDTVPKDKEHGDSTGAGKLYRGHPYMVTYGGLEPLSAKQ